MRLLLTMNLPYTRVHGGANRANRLLFEALAEHGHETLAVVPALETPPTRTCLDVRRSLEQKNVEVTEHLGNLQFRLNGVRVHAVTEPYGLRSHLSAQIGEFVPDWVIVSSEDPSQNLLSASLKAAPGRVAYYAHTPQMFPFGPASFFPERGTHEPASASVPKANNQRVYAVLPLALGGSG